MKLTPSQQKKSLDKLIENKESLNIVDIQVDSKPNKKRTFPEENNKKKNHKKFKKDKKKD